MTEHKKTLCYTYEVTMIVQVLAESKDHADSKLEKEGGYVSKREVLFKNEVPLYSGSNTEELVEE